MDGGLGTELEARNLDLKGTLWSAKALYEHPEIIHQIHYNYFKAGAEILAVETIPSLLEAEAIMEILAHMPG